jgi:predicted enzyme involved in methoxymalonyl-ACP biosynthesis
MEEKDIKNVDVNILDAEITSIKGREIKVSDISGNPLGVIKITEDTKLEKLTLKEDDKGNKQWGEPEELKREDLKEGDSISAVLQDEPNPSEKMEATHIRKIELKA